MLEFDLWRILDILFKRIDVRGNQKLIFRNLSYRNSVDSVAEILPEISRAFMQISEVLVQNPLAEPKQNPLTEPKQNPLTEPKQNPLAQPKQNSLAQP